MSDFRRIARRLRISRRGVAGFGVPIARSAGFLSAAFVLSFLIVTAPAPSAALDPSTEEIAEDKWTLNRLIEEAIENYPGVRASMDAMEANKAQVRAARWQFFPAPSVGVETFEGNPVVTAELSQPLWTGGRLNADLDFAKAQLDAAKWGVAEAQINLALQIVEQYQQFASATLVLTAYDHYIADLDEFSTMMERRVTQGYSASVDAKLVAARLNEARNVRTNLLLARKTSIEALSFFTGRDLEPSDIHVSASDAQDLELALTDGEFLARSADANPTLNRLSDEITAARAQVRQARSALSPVVSVRAQHREFTFSPITENRVFLAMDFSLGGGLSSFEGLRSARSQSNQAYNAREAFRVDFSNSIQTDLETLRATKELVGVLSTNRVTQREIYESYLRMFLVGQRTWLDVLNVMREAVEAERRLAESRATYIATLFRLRINVGDVRWPL